MSPNGPHSQTWSTPATGTRAVSRRRSRSASSRPENSSTSRGSRESTCTRSRRAPWRFFRSASSSANITVPVRAVAVEQRHLGRRVGQHRAGDREHRGDPGAGGDAQVPAGRARVGAEAAGRGLHLDRVAGPHLAHQPGGEEPVGDLAHADPRRRARPGRRWSRSGGAPGRRRCAAGSATARRAKSKSSRRSSGTSKVTAAASSVRGARRRPRSARGTSRGRGPGAGVIRSP